MSEVMAGNRPPNAQRSHSASKKKTSPSLPVSRASSGRTAKKLPPLESVKRASLKHATKDGLEDQDDSAPVTTQDVLRICQESDPLKVPCVDLHGRKLMTICDLSKFTRARSFDLSGNFLERIEGLDANQQLKQLKLYDNKIVVVENLECLVDLTDLQLQYNLIENVGGGLSSLRNLTSLRLDNNKLKVINVRELAPLAKTLRTLDISGNRLEDVSAVVACKLLEELKLNENQLTTLPPLKSLEKLKELEASDNVLGRHSHRRYHRCHRHRRRHHHHRHCRRRYPRPVALLPRTLRRLPRRQQRQR